MYIIRRKHNSYGLTRSAISENGYCYTASNILYYYDINKDINSAVCSKAECSHNSSDCDAYIYATNAFKSDITANCDGSEVFYYNEKLYMFERDSENNVCLCQYNSSFNNREVIAPITDFTNDLTIFTGSGAGCIVDGYFYYTIYLYNTDRSESRYIFPFYCMRVKLTPGSEPEKLGEFEFAGDYGVLAGSSAGVRAFAAGDDVYYIAGGAIRAYENDKNVQYRVAKYSLKTGEFNMLWTYTGDDADDIWGTGFGQVQALSDNICMDNETADIYVMTTNELYDVCNSNIACINFETGEKKVIYSTEYSDMDQLIFDGEYLYFTESDMLKGVTYLTVLNKDGSDIARFEIQHSDEYKKMIEEQNIDPEARVINGVKIFGVDDRYILMGAYENVYKNLSSADPKESYSKYDTYNPPVTGVAVIDKSELLSGKDDVMRQIYKYEE